MKDMFHPVFAMFCLTMFTIARLGYLRVKSSMDGTVPAHEYKTFQNHKPPEAIAKTTRHVTNLFEVPILFYIICLFISRFSLTDEIYILFAYAFVLLRFVHSAIHLTYNHVLHRFWRVAWL